MMTTEALQGNISRMLTDEAVYVTYVFLYVLEVIFVIVGLDVKDAWRPLRAEHFTTFMRDLRVVRRARD